MQLKKNEAKGTAILHSTYSFLRSKKFLILTIFIVFIAGGFFGIVTGGFFGTLDKPTPKAEEFVKNTLQIIGIDAHSVQIGLSNILNENYKIPINYVNGLTSKPERIVIDIKNNDFQKLAYKREIALANGILITSDDDYVPAKIQHNGKTIDAKLRLKGDWTDHLKGDKWSFRIKTKGDDTLFGMKVFSIQNPITRNYLNEWLFLKTLEREDLIALRYNFVDVTINGKYKGVYALEEHFDKRLIENNEYREGPIIRFDEDLVWLGLIIENELSEPYISSEINAFQSSKIIEDPDKFEEYIKAKDLLESFRNGKLKTSEVFDANKFAKFMAISDLMGGSHGNVWHNSRFYYNPVTSKLEPIGFDASAGQKIKNLQCENNDLYHETIFNDSLLFEIYIQELEHVSDRSYLDNLLYDLDDNLQSNISILHKDIPYYHFSKDVYYNNQKFIQNKLNPIKGLNCYFYNNTTNGSIILEVGNIQSMPIEVLNVTFQDSVIFEPKNEMNILYKTTSSELIQYQKIEFVLPEGFTWSDQYISKLKLNYRILGHSRLRNETIVSWSHLSDDFTENDFIRHSSNVEQFEFLLVDEDSKRIIMRPGVWILNESLIIPPDYIFMYSGNAHTEINLIDNATILSYSPLQLLGNEDYPLTITSSDSTGQGIAVLNAKEKSILKWVAISNLSAPSKNGWKLSGAITFYESPVVIENSYLSYNKFGDDLLNIVRSEFEITNSVFDNSLSDALDVDFGVGTISQSVFIASGNDAMDISGSVVNIIDSNVYGTGDKGVSGGEASQININRIYLTDCNIAIASKDRSVLNVNDITLSSCNIGFSAYQKKSEFGPGSISAYSVDMNDVDKPYIIEFDSSLWIDDKEVIEGKEKDVYSRFYGK